MKFALALLIALTAWITLVPAAAQEATPTPVTYVVQRGDTLGNIASRFGISVRDLMRVNNISNAELIYAGQTLIIPAPTSDAPTSTLTPGSTASPTSAPTLAPTSLSPSPTAEGTTYVVQRGDTLARIAARFGSSVSAILRANNLANPDVIYVGQRLIIPAGTTANPATPAPTDTFNAPDVPFGYGVEVFIAGTDPGTVIDHITALSLNWAKIHVNWRDLELVEGTINVRSLDQIVTALDAAGINILLTVSGTPSWAGADSSSPPDDLSLYATFVGALAGHYAGVVDGYEIWLAPNLRQNWNNPAHPLEAATYVNLLGQSYNAIKAADSAAYVVSAGLAGVSATSEAAVNDRDYLTAMYVAGLRSISDAVGVQAYGFGNAPDLLCCTSTEATHVDSATYYFLSTLSDYRGIMTRQGDTDTQVWITGFGWGTSEDTAPPSAEEIYFGYNTLEEQSLYTARAFEIGAQLGFVGPMFVSNLNGCAVNQACAYSLIAPSETPRPVYNLVRILFAPAQ